MLLDAIKCWQVGFGYNIDHILGDRLSDSILEYATSIGATDLVIDKSIRPKWQDKIFGSVAYDIIRNNNKGMQVHIVSINKKEHKFQEQPRHNKFKPKDLVVDVIKSALITAASGIFIFFNLSIVGLVSQTLCFLMVLSSLCL